MNFLRKKIVKIIGFFVGIIVVILITLTLTINFFYRERLMNYVVSQLNEQIDAKISIKSATFTFWRTFPGVSVQFNNVLVSSSNSFLKQNTNSINSDSLIVAENVYFEFNLIKLISKKYVLKRIHINNGIINLIDYKSGVSNYSIFKSRTSNSNASEITLKKLLISNSKIKYRHITSNISVLAKAKKVLINGTIHKSHIKLVVKSDLMVEYVFVNGKNYLSNRPVKTNLPLEIINNTVYNFAQSEVYISNIPLLFKGSLTTSSINFIDFSFLSKNVDLSDVFSVLPSDLKHKADNYNAIGKLNFQVTIKGRTGNLFYPNILLKLGLSNANVTERLSKIKLAELDLDLIYSNGLRNNSESSYIQINKFTSKIGSGNFSIMGKVESFTNPKVQLNCINYLNINDLKLFFKLDSIDVLEGIAESNVIITGNINKLSDFKLIDAKQLNYTGQLTISDGSFKIARSNFLFSDINGLLNFNNDLYFNNLLFKVNNSSIQLSGKMENGISVFLGNSKNTFIEADLTSQFVDLSNFFSTNKSSKNNQLSNEFLFPENLSFNLKLNINDFKLNKFNAKRVKGNLSYKPGMFVLKALSFETCEGAITGNGAIIQDSLKNFLVKAQSNIFKINIRQLFGTFNNFGQTVLRENHIKGRVSGNINFTSVWNQYLNLYKDKLIVESDVTINNGELLNFEPLLGLSKFIAVEELKNIKFSTLHNNILIKDKQVIIPQMEVQSSAFNISGSGIHNFDNHYNYKVRVLLSEFLYGKAKKAKKENEEYGRIEDDGLGKTSLYLSIEGFGKNYKITYDSRKTIDIVKESFIHQKRELKEIFREEFGWFKRDSTLGKQKKSNNTIFVEWDDEENLNKKIAKPDKLNDKKVNSDDKLEVEWE